jgi:two-component system, LytTR family, response regulator
MTIIALDDEPLALLIIEKFTKAVAEVELLATFTNADAAKDFLINNTVDLLLIDINMPDISGLVFVRNLTDEKPMVIFITAYKEHAIDGFDLEVIDYLVKPISPERFQRALRKALDLKLMKEKAEQNEIVPNLEYFFVYAEYQQVKITVKEILYIESMGDYVKIHLVSQLRPVLTLERLKNLTLRLESSGFQRIHRSFLVNLAHIDAMQKSQVKIGEIWLPVGASTTLRS